MRRFFAALLLFLASPASADVLIDNVEGLTLDDEGEVRRFNGVLVGDDGRIKQVLDRRDKRPGQVDYRLDGKGLVLIPGLIDSHAHVMELGLALLTRTTAPEAMPKGKPRPVDRDLAFLEAQQALLARGITTIVDMGTTIEEWQTYRRAGDSGHLQIRLVAYAEGVENMVLIGGPGPTPWLYDDRLKLNGVLLMLNGPLRADQAAPEASRGEAPRTNGPITTEAQLKNLMSRGAIDGFQVAVEVTGHVTNASVLDAIDELSETYQGDRRWRIELAPMFDAADIPRLRELGVVASMRPQRPTANPWPDDDRYAQEHAASSVGWNSLIEAGAAFAFGSDALMEPPQPFEGMAMATAIANQDEFRSPFADVQPQEHTSHEEVFSAYTTGAAHALFAENRIGRIAEGFEADFVLIDHDPLLTTPQQFRSARVLQTWVGGKLVYEAEDNPVR